MMSLGHVRLGYAEEDVAPEERLPRFGEEPAQQRQRGRQQKIVVPLEPPADYTITFERQTLQDYVSKWEAKNYLRLRPERLRWTPFFDTFSDSW